ncbi:hypothetical protein V9L05_00945 [Bernardetia sp. Wsw4-3y2]|uniref:hypothetical protein n=1 Tax=Bernardetia sp. Wsw4-3y2 TaxID=3127471 RepID=UPI0030D2034C
MKKLPFTFLLLIICVYSCFAQTDYSFADFIDDVPSNIKKITAWNSEITEKGDTITSKSEYWQYDKNKNLLLWAKPQMYCQIEKKYDEQNRIISLEKYCGESSDNGIITISYPSKNTIIEKHGLSGYSVLIKKQFSYNSKGKLIREEVYDSLYDEVFNPSSNKYEIYHSVTVYKYDKNDNLIEKNRFDLPNLTTAETTKYMYNKYNQILREEINTKQDDGNFNTSITKYSYYGYLHKGETKPKIFIINNTLISDYSTETKTKQYIYPQKNVLEIEITQTNTRINPTSKETYQLIYKNNQLIRKKYFSMPQKNQDRKVMSWIDYQYIFY